MSRWKWFLALGAIFLVAACADQKTGPTGAVADTPENRKAAAQRYLEAMPPQEMLNNVAENISKRLPEPARKSFLDAMHDKDLLAATTRITTEGLVKHFTAAELNALAAFYGSPEGKSARTKFGPYMGDVMPQINDEVRKVVAKVQEQAPKAGQPAPEPPKAGAPQAAQPQPAQPQAEQLKAAPPQAEPSKAEKPTGDAPKPAPPKAK